MELFMITSSVESEQEAERFCLKFRAIGNPGQSNPVFRFRFDYAAGRVSAVCQDDGVTTVSGRALSALKARVADAMGEYVAEEKEMPLLRRMLNRNFSFPKSEDTTVIETMSSRLLDGIEEDPAVRVRERERRIAEISRIFYEYLRSCDYVDVDGFLSFRMKGYTDKLKEALDYAVDEYRLGQQYEQFISLLKYFVQFQEPQLSLIHLLHTEGTEFILMDEAMRPIDPLPGEGVTAQMADQEMEMEDVVVSTLITLSPRRIVIHTREPDTLIISTIQQIFGERAEVRSTVPSQKA